MKKEGLTINYRRLTEVSGQLFARTWRLYQGSFPVEERRRLSAQKRIMNRPPYHFEVVTEGSRFVGLIFWWEFDNLRYVEHLATAPRLRRRGYGERILRHFIAAAHTPILLEVEIPSDEMSKRRINFYQRAGFVLNSHPYSHPPYQPGGDPVPLMVMTYPGGITKMELRRFVRTYHPIIHHFELTK